MNESIDAKGNKPMPTVSNDDYTYELDLNAIPDDERELLKLLFSSMKDLADYISEDAAHNYEPNPYMENKSRDDVHLTHADYDGDHTDYLPAASSALHNVVCALTSDIFWALPVNDDVASALSLTKDDEGRYPYSVRTRLAVILSAPDMLTDLETCAVSWLAGILEPTDD